MQKFEPAKNWTVLETGCIIKIQGKGHGGLYRITGLGTDAGLTYFFAAQLRINGTQLTTLEATRFDAETYIIVIAENENALVPAFFETIRTAAENVE